MAIFHNSFYSNRKQYLDIMKIKEAEYLFHGEDHYNCAQALFKAFQKEFAVAEDKIIGAKSKGGGRAEEGLCGALYAAVSMVSEPSFDNDIKEQFQLNGGSIYCRELKMHKRLSCKECVKLAASCVQSQLTELGVE